MGSTHRCAVITWCTDMEEDDEPGGDEESFTEMEGALPHYPSGRPKPQFVVPAPQRLVLERQLNKSILIGWLPPDVVLGSLESYQVATQSLRNNAEIPRILFIPTKNSPLRRFT